MSTSRGRDDTAESALETSLHRELKTHYAGRGETEVRLGAYRIDAVRRDELIEVQCASLSAIRDKIGELCQTRKLRVVKPIVARRRIIRQASEDGPVTSRRLSPKRGELLDVFDELVFLRRVFPHPNLTLEVPLVRVEEWRLPPPEKRNRRRRYPAKHLVKDVVLEEILSTQTIRSAADLKRLVRLNELPKRFDTAELAKLLERPRHVAQKIAYVLRHINAIEMVGKRGNALVYRQRRGRRKAA